jgi:ssDNA-specific exonuclease RecJ
VGEKNTFRNKKERLKINQPFNMSSHKNIKVNLEETGESE